MSKKSIILSVIVGALLCMGPIRANALSIYFDQPGVNVIEGDNFTVDLLADILSTEQILGWDIDLLYNDTQVALTEYIVGTDWNAVTPNPDDDESMAGLAAGFPLPAFTGIWGTGVQLATLSFNCLAVGTSLLDISIDDALEGFQLASMQGFATWTSQSTTVNQAPVPEPSTILLVGTGLLGIIGFGRKRLNKKA